MRPGAEFPMSHGAPTAAPHALVNGTAAPHALVNGTAAAHSPWQSPVPYLFGGLAAMMGLIAFALLILACSYWKLSGYLDGGSGADQAGSAGGADEEKGSAAGATRPAVGFLEHVVVIMAGDGRPTFLATPTTSLGASPALNSGGDGGSEEEEKKVEEQGCEVSPQPQLGGHGTDAVSRSHESSSTTTQQESSQ